MRFSIWVIFCIYVSTKIYSNKSNLRRPSYSTEFTFCSWSNQPMLAKNFRCCISINRLVIVSSKSHHRPIHYTLFPDILDTISSLSGADLSSPVIITPKYFASSKSSRVGKYYCNKFSFYKKTRNVRIRKYLSDVSFIYCHLKFFFRCDWMSAIKLLNLF